MATWVRAFVPSTHGPSSNANSASTLPRVTQRRKLERLCRLKQTGGVHDYINDFTTLILEISDMSDKDSFFYFQDSLKNWAKVELDRRGVQTLDDAITIAESLAEYLVQPKDKRPSHGKGGGEGRKDKGHNRKECGQKIPPSSKSGQSKSEKQQPPKPQSPCFRSNAPIGSATVWRKSRPML